MGLVVYCDGACEPVNPGGYACWAWVALRDGKEVQNAHGCLGHGAGMTNNLAEYHAVIRALESLDEEIDEIRTDSKLVVEQVNGRWAVNAPALRPLVNVVQKLLAPTRTRLVWVPRADNERADALSRRAYTEQRAAR